MLVIVVVTVIYAIVVYAFNSVAEKVGFDWCKAADSRHGVYPHGCIAPGSRELVSHQRKKQKIKSESKNRQRKNINKYKSLSVVI